MDESTIIKLAQDLEWLGCELEFLGHKHAMQGFPESGSAWDIFCERQRDVLATADKIERELKNSVRFNPNRLVGIEYPISDTLDSITELLGEVETIKQATIFAVDKLPVLVREFTNTVKGRVQEVGATRD